jgi:hypothetical protein
MLTLNHETEMITSKKKNNEVQSLTIQCWSLKIKKKNNSKKKQLKKWEINLK